MEHDHKKDKDENDLKMNPDGSLDGSPKELGEVKKTMAGFDITTKEGRAAARAKLAQKAGAGAWNEWLNKAHPGPGPQAADFTTKPSGDLGKIEKIDEIHKAMEDVLKSTSPKVRKQAAEIQELITVGKITEADLPDLVANGVDSAAVSYWKQYYGQAKNGGPQFAAELLKDKAVKKAADDAEVFKVKYARAYDLANAMVSKAMISGDAKTVKAQVEELMSFNDEGFQSFARLVAKTPKVATASFVPQMGVGAVMAPSVLLPEASDSHDELVRTLTQAISR